jgi:hypothetical protein
MQVARAIVPIFYQHHPPAMHSYGTFISKNPIAKEKIIENITLKMFIFL